MRSLCRVKQFVSMIKYLMSFQILCAGLQAATAAFALALLLFILQNRDNRDRYDLLAAGGDSLELHSICLARFPQFDWKRATCSGRTSKVG